MDKRLVNGSICLLSIQSSNPAPYIWDRDFANTEDKWKLRKGYQRSTSITMAMQTMVIAVALTTPTKMMPKMKNNDYKMQMAR